MRRGERRGRALPGAVGALCRALPPRSRPAPDTLRRARFDRPQASLDFWRLLYALLKQIHGGKWTESDAIDNQIRFVKSALWYHGYGRPELYRLPSDGSAGSRELLLAFSWLLHRLSLLEQLLARNRVKTGDETSVCTCEDDLPNSQEGTTEIAPEYGIEDRVDVRYLQWLNGRLRFQWRSLHAQHQEQCKLLHKIHLFTSGSHMDQILGHFSVTETDLVRQPENYKQLLQLLESETMQLEAFLEWKQLEPVYWQWMETVLDNMAEEANMCEFQDTCVEKSGLPKATSCCPWADRLTGQIDRLSRDLTTLRDQLHELVTCRKAAWCEKVSCGDLAFAAKVMMAISAASPPPAAATPTIKTVSYCSRLSVVIPIPALAMRSILAHVVLRGACSSIMCLAQWIMKFSNFGQWRVKTREEDLQKEWFSATARKIHESVELKLLDLACLCAPKKNKMHGSCRLLFRSKHPAGKTGFSRSVAKEPVSAVSATEVIRELQMREASLERELKQLQEECRQRLDEIAEGLDGVICISP